MALYYMGRKGDVSIWTDSEGQSDSSDDSDREDLEWYRYKPGTGNTALRPEELREKYGLPTPKKYVGVRQPWYGDDILSETEVVKSSPLEQKDMVNQIEQFTSEDEGGENTKKKETVEQRPLIKEIARMSSEEEGLESNRSLLVTGRMEDIAMELYHSDTPLDNSEDEIPCSQDGPPSPSMLDGNTFPLSPPSPKRQEPDDWKGEDTPTHAEFLNGDMVTSTPLIQTIKTPTLPIMKKKNLRKRGKRQLWKKNQGVIDLTKDVSDERRRRTPPLVKKTKAIDIKALEDKKDDAKRYRMHLLDIGDMSVKMDDFFDDVADRHMSHDQAQTLKDRLIQMIELPIVWLEQQMLDNAFTDF